jgi:hypothetical protein
MHPTFYMTRVHRPVTRLAAVLSLALAGAGGLAQTPAAPAPPPPPLGRTASEPSQSGQLIENIQVDSASARIDEQRFGGETRRISVAPKGGFPVYEVQPQGGARTWKILGF